MIPLLQRLWSADPVEQARAKRMLHCAVLGLILIVAAPYIVQYFGINWNNLPGNLPDLIDKAIKLFQGIGAFICVLAIINAGKKLATSD